MVKIKPANKRWLSFYVAPLILLLVAHAGCAPKTPPPQCRVYVVRVYRPDGTLHKEYRGCNRGAPQLVYTPGGVTWMWLGTRCITAATGWQIDTEPEVVNGEYLPEVEKTVQ